MVTTTHSVNQTRETSSELYLQLMKDVLTGSILQERSYIKATPARRSLRAISRPVQALLGRFGMAVMYSLPYEPNLRAHGRDWPANAHTMIGHRRLDNLQACLTRAVHDGIKGDFIETGVWRGGASILAKAILKSLGQNNRNVWLADSFQGLPKPDTKQYPQDSGDRHWAIEILAVSQDEVRQNFQLYGLLDDSVKFLPGWFKDTLPSAPIEKIAVMRLDGDMYGSTMDALRALYPKLESGGFCLVDDYGTAGPCAQAVQDYLEEQGSTVELIDVDGAESYWRKP